MMAPSMPSQDTAMAKAMYQAFGGLGLSPTRTTASVIFWNSFSPTGAVCHRLGSRLASAMLSGLALVHVVARLLLRHQVGVGVGDAGQVGHPRTHVELFEEVVAARAVGLLRD